MSYDKIVVWVLVVLLYAFGQQVKPEPLTPLNKTELRGFFNSVKNTLPYAKKCLRLLRLYNSQKYSDCIKYKKLMIVVSSHLVDIRLIEKDEQKKFQITYNNVLYDKFEEYNTLTTLSYVIKKRSTNEQ